MASKYWIKMYHEILDDPKMGRLPCNLWRRFFECCLMAGEKDEAGFLPELSDMAWRFRVDERTLHQELTALSEQGLIILKEYNPFEARWFIVNFEKRQKPSDASERVREFRKRKRNERVTKSNACNAPDTDIDVDTDDITTVRNFPFPTTPKEALEHPDIKLFYSVSGITPGIDDYAFVIDSVNVLRKDHPDENDLASYMTAFWVEWTNPLRKTVNGEPYNRKNPKWLEWAINNDVPPIRAERKNGNSYQPAKANILQGMSPA